MISVKANELDKSNMISISNNRINEVSMYLTKHIQLGVAVRVT